MERVILPSTVILLLLVLTCKCQNISFGNETLRNNSAASNITGATNRTLENGINFSCKWNYDFKLLQSATSAVVILSGVFVLSLGMIIFLLFLVFIP